MLDIGCVLLGSYGDIDLFTLSFLAPDPQTGVTEESFVACDDDLRAAVGFPTLMLVVRL